MSSRPSPSTTYGAIHDWIQDHFQKTGRCDHCGGTSRRTEWASVGHTYVRDRTQWLELCKPCHIAMDGPNGNARKTHCAHGHEFTEANIYHARGRRYCRTCRRENRGKK